LTRFLCGITSPRLSRSKLNAHALFGSLEKAPFADVLARTEQEQM
jgi:ATP-dependent DNA helicase RecQ